MRRWPKRIILLLAGMIGAVRRLFLCKNATRIEIPAGEESNRQNEAVRLKQRLWQTTKYFVVFTIFLVVAGFLLAAAGVIPIKASSGHWAVTRWLLEFSMRRSVATYATGLHVPALDDPRFMPRGAGAYDINCSWCHGRPGFEYPRVAQHMTPPPPYLPPMIQQRKPEELFYIVKHGIKFTGMPAWPTQQRDDEVWAMVAFLRQFPQLDADEYQRLVGGESSFDEVSLRQSFLGPELMARLALESCGRCHGSDGLGGIMNAFPRLAGQQPAYLLASLRAYARAERHSGFMGPIAAALSEEQMSWFAGYYAELKGPATVPRVEDVVAIQRGRSIALNGIPDQRVPACFYCHGPGELPRNPNYPHLAGQPQDYLVQQLTLFKEGKRGGTAYSHLMREVAPYLTPAQMQDVALYYSSLIP